MEVSIVAVEESSGAIVEPTQSGAVELSSEDQEEEHLSVNFNINLSLSGHFCSIWCSFVYGFTVNMIYTVFVLLTILVTSRF